MALAVMTSATIPLTGCASSGGAAGAGSTSSILDVHVGVFGGPLLPDGKMAASNAPRAGATVKVSDGAGHRWTATTGQNGIASMTVPAGRYTVTSSSCGPAQHANALAGKTSYVQIQCDVP